MDDGTERGKEEGNERNEEPARCPLPAAREAQFPKQHHGAWQTPGHGWIGGGYNSGSIGDVCWDGALAITEQKHPRPILVSLVSQARRRCGVGASSPFCDSYFSIRGSPIKTLIVDSCRYREQSRVRNRPPWRCLEINQPTNACLARPSRLFRSGRIPTGVEGGGDPLQAICAVTRVALLVRQGLVFQARSRAHEKVVVCRPFLVWSWLVFGYYLQAMTSETTCAWFSALTVCALAE